MPSRSELIVRAARRIKGMARELVRPEFTYRGRAWPGESGPGWSDTSVADAQSRRWQEFLAATSGTAPLGVAHEAQNIRNDLLWAHNQVMTFGYVLGLAAQEGRAITVLDWGGGIGHFARYARVLYPELRIDYHCRDLPHLCSVGRELHPQVAFHDRDDSLLGMRFDVVLASGSLQYARSWSKQLRFLIGVAAPWLLVTRVPVVEDASFVAEQRAHHHGYETTYISWCINRQALLDAAATSGGKLEREFLTGERHRVRGARESPVLRGFLFRRVAPL